MTCAIHSKSRSRCRRGQSLKSRCGGEDQVDRACASMLAASGEGFLDSPGSVVCARRRRHRRQRGYFDAELTGADHDALPGVLSRRAVVGNDGFLNLLLSTPFDVLVIGSPEVSLRGARGTGHGHPLVT